MKVVTRKTDGKARVTLPAGYANCLVTIEQHGDEAIAYVTAKLLVLRSEKDEIGEQAWTLIAEAVKELQSTDPKGPLN